MADLWTQPSGTNIADLEEQVTVAVDLPLSDTEATVTLISGSLPGGIRLLGTQLVGTPYEVARVTESRFVLRAELNGVIKDRTFTATVSGPDVPVWTTAEGLLPVGNNSTYYILDSSPVEFQLVATDEDIEAGQTLEYYIASGDGELPPGIELTRDGRLVGIVDPILAIERALLYEAGTYDTAPYDFVSGGYDFGERSSNGFDSFYYDTTIYDFKYAERTPKKLNRYYQFTVSVSDGDTVARRTFRIFVVGDDFLRADNTVMNAGTGVFTADNTNIRTPIWLTPADLGVRRANNYVTLFLDTIDVNTLTGVISYDVVTTPGLYEFEDGARTYGRWDISREFPSHPIDGLSSPVSIVNLIAGERYVITKVGNSDFRQWGATFNAVGHVFTATGHPVISQTGEARRIDFVTVTPEIGPNLPPGLSLDPSTGEMGGRVPYQSDVTKSYSFTVRATRYTPDQAAENTYSDKTFTVRLLGEFDSETLWVTDSNLGTIGSNVISVLRVEATTNVPGSAVIYSLASGRLPPGLRLSPDGEIVGKVNAFGTNVYKSIWKPSRNYSIGDVVKYDGLYYRALTTHQSTSTGLFSTDAGLWADFAYETIGLTVFDNDTWTTDGGTTSYDREYIFTVAAQDLYRYSIVNKQFVIKVEDPDTRRYSNISMKPFLKETTRKNFRDFISDPEIFIPEHIYRPGDPNFGIQSDIEMLVYAGIETKELEQFVAAMSTNHRRKQYKVGDLKIATAKVPGTNTEVYDVLYLDVIDPAEPTSGRTRTSFNIQNSKKILVNSASATPTDIYYDYTDNPTFTVFARGKTINVTLGEDFIVQTRDDGTFSLQWDQGIEIDGRTEQNLIRIVEGLGPTMTLRPEPEPNTIKTSTSNIKVSQSRDNVRYVSNITNMRDKLRPLGVTERDFVPLWMRTAQEGQVNELGYIPAIVLCYTKPGKAEIIRSAINASGFDFSQFNLDMDRYIIDSTQASSEPQYLLFANYQFNI
jgi:hypothetical protein